jgi:anti-sigma factor RsiW
VKKPSSHIRFEQLVDLVDGRLPAEDQSQIVAHLAACPQCTAEKAWLERVIGLMRTDTTESAPPVVIARTLKLFTSRQQPAAPEPRQRRRIFASLWLDNAMPPLAFGLRSGQAEARQRLYSAGSYDLDLRLKPVNQEWVVSGQLLGAAASGTAKLLGDAAQVESELNALSEFTFSAVPSGLYTLVLYLDDVEIEVTILELG